MLFFLLAFSYSLLSATSFDNTIIKLNPDYKLKRLSGGIVVMTSVKNGETVNHQFNDLYADLLLAAYRKQRLGFIIDSLSKKYYYSDEECRREVKHALNILSEWNIVLREDKLARL